MISTEEKNNKRIAKNSFFLYIRMIVLMIISLFSSRIILKCLGASDYGIYNVMGGIIGMLGYANTLLAGGISRFLTIALGKGDEKGLTILFGTTKSVAIFSAIVVLFLGETIGLWFVNSQLSIDSGRMYAANWVYQCALLASCLTIIQSPYAASVISHEKMNIFAFISLSDAVIKLVIVISLLYVRSDRLILYSILLLLTASLVYVSYRIICAGLFQESRAKLQMEWPIFKEMLQYSSWNMVGGLAGILSNHGVNLIVNIFFGTIVNAARGIATQVSSLIRNLYTSFQTAATPQIMKYYSQGKMTELYSLVINSSKYSSYILLCAIVPILVNTESLLNIWLTDVPPFTVRFSQCIITYEFICAIDAPLGQAIHAVGRMKVPNLTTAIVNFLVFPLTYFMFKYGARPEWGYIFQIIAVSTCLFIDIAMVKYFLGFPVADIFKKVLLPVASLSAICFMSAFLIKYLLDNGTVVRTLSVIVLEVMVVAAMVFFIGLTKEDRKIALKWLQ